MKRQFNIVQTSLKMEKKIITANSFHETNITLIPSPQKKKKRRVKGKLLANLTDELGVLQVQILAVRQQYIKNSHHDCIS